MGAEAVAHETYGLLIGMLTFFAIVAVVSAVVFLNKRQDDLERRVDQIEREIHAQPSRQ